MSKGRAMLRASAGNIGAKARRHLNEGVSGLAERFYLIIDPAPAAKSADQTSDQSSSS
jgi:hypothetical protein